MRDYVVFSDVSKYYQMGQMVIKAIDHINFLLPRGILHNRRPVRRR